MKGSSIESDFAVGDTVQARSYLPYGTQDFVAPGTRGTVRKKDPSNGSYVIEFETGATARANGDMLAPA